MKQHLKLCLAALALTPCATAAQNANPVVLPTVEVVGVSPVSGSGIDADKIPSSTSTMRSGDFDVAKSPDLLQSMVRGLPFVSLSDTSGNPFQLNLDYRGFTASPVPGTVQGLAVYQNGARINEAYGDIVNWDFIPQMAINRLTLQTNNPVFGLNALGGAISIEMKNGFNYHGTEIQGLAGSFGRVSGAAQTGIQKENFAAYAAIDALWDSGWRDFSSSSQLRRTYVDLGARGDTTEFHVSFTGADNKLGAVAATPFQLLNQSWSSIYTWPQTTHLQLAFFQANGSWKPTDTFSVNANAYYRSYRASHFDGNGTDAVVCDDPTLLCIGDGATPLNQNVPVPNTLSPDAFLAEIDRNWTQTNSFGGSLQATNTAQVWGHDNHIVVGASLDRGRTRFNGNSELGTIDQSLFVTGTGVFIDQPAADITPVNLRATNTYVGVYATDTFDITSKLSVTAGGRFNFAQINLADQTGQSPDLNGNNQFQRLNPVIGFTYKLTSDLTAYAGYSEANRAPTPLELGCASPTHPCMIDNFLIADPPLQQVVAHTYEAGLRGKFTTADAKGQLNWSLGAFHTLSTNDIINVASPAIQGFGFFQNAGSTLRQGIEAKVDYKYDRWTAYANYTFIDATYRTALTISSPDNPAADVNGNIFVVPGNHIPGIPAHRFKAGAEYNFTDAWKIGADLNVVGTQYFIHDDSNQFAKVPAYWVVNLHSSYQVTKNVEVFGLIQNLFNTRYYASGTFFQTGGFTNVGGGDNLFANLTDPRTFLPGMPLAAYAGIKATF
jgi:iron complex outermembrane recepter protein